MNKYTKKILFEFERAVRADEMKGAAPPIQRSIIGAEYILARVTLEAVILELEEQVENSQQ